MIETKEIQIPATPTSEPSITAVITFDWEVCERTGAKIIEDLRGLILYIGDVTLNGNALLHDEWYFDYIVQQIESNEEC